MRHYDSRYFSPPVASRIFVYPNVAAYEIINKSWPIYKLKWQLNGLGSIPIADPKAELIYLWRH
jgi:hypothetical protein